MDEKQTDTVKWFNDTKGFGFIIPNDGGFRNLAEGEMVEFGVESGNDGRMKVVDVDFPPLHLKNIFHFGLKNQDFIGEFLKETKKMGSRLLEMISEGLGLKPDYFDGKRSELQIVNVNRYPASP